MALEFGGLACHDRRPLLNWILLLKCTGYGWLKRLICRDFDHSRTQKLLAPSALFFCFCYFCFVFVFCLFCFFFEVAGVKQ